jgi:hypothetical protein
MRRLEVHLPHRQTVLAVLGLAGDALLIAVVYWANLRLVNDVSSSRWIATAAKYIGFGFAALLGVVGTVTDTKERLPDGRYKVRRIGWLVLLALLLSSILGAIGQYYEDMARELAEEARITRLNNIAEISEKNLARLSGDFHAKIYVRVAETPQLTKAMRHWERTRQREKLSGAWSQKEADAINSEFQAALKHYTFLFTVTVPTKPAAKTLRGEIEGVYTKWRASDGEELTLEGDAIVKIEQNDYLYSVRDFDNCRVEVAIYGDAADSDDALEPYDLMLFDNVWHATIRGFSLTRVKDGGRVVYRGSATTNT